MRQWYHPKIDFGWKETQSPGTRQRHLMECTDPSLSWAERYQEAAEAVQKLATFGDTAEIRKKAQEDAYMLFRKAKAMNAEPKAASEPKSRIDLYSEWDAAQSADTRIQRLIERTDIRSTWATRYQQAAQKALSFAARSDDPEIRAKAESDAFVLQRKAKAAQRRGV